MAATSAPCCSPSSSARCDRSWKPDTSTSPNRRCTRQKVSNKETVYLKDDTAKEEFLASRPNYTKDFQRLKGLGEMDWDELRNTTMNVSSRSLLQVSVEQVAIADDVTSILMGDDVEQRKNFIVTNAREVRNLDF